MFKKVTNTLKRSIINAFEKQQDPNMVSQPFPFNLSLCLKPKKYAKSKCRNLFHSQLLSRWGDSYL